MNIDDIHRWILLAEDKQQVSWHTPQEIDDNLHRGQLDIFWKYAPIYGKDETAKKACDPFKVKFTVTGANSVGGRVNLPGYDPITGLATPLTFAHLLSGSAVSFDNTINPATGQPYGQARWPIEFVNDDEIDFRLRSQLKPVTVDKPVATTDGGGVIQLYPQVPNAGYFTYLAVPVAPVYAFTPGGPGNRVLTYNAGASTQLQWNESFLTQIMSKALVYLGINMDDQQLIQLMAQNQ